MKIGNKKLQRSFYRILLAVGGTSMLIVLILAIETTFGAEKTCQPTESWLFCQIRESVLLNIVEGFSILVAVWLFFLEAPERDKQAHYEAWKTIDSAHGLRNSYARLQALQDLNDDRIPLRGFTAPEADLRGINLEGADLSNAYLSGADLSNANLSNANLSHANLVETKLTNANLSNSQLTGANLSYTDLIEADLQDVDFVGANILGTNFVRANLTRAYFGDVDFNQCLLTNANLHKTKFFGVENLTAAQIKDAKNWSEGIYDAKMSAKLNYS
ncbi:pentapeptide repeat-containing protein [Waterburya agarophytonicola K14]|uniref:Pentapeptide repeat-containing protein n=1 Tax=Waterburya agarophytonicola KI4 TaxID=2874699 RepID=A0A964BRS9_9CYAN|nr:pentapeptide repeat-containing protein [Waterburya agarophytonicola]MCC0177016.1 pentapeptide repeat-containing protein [Waterburya agarophytonicola KI4]